VHIGVALIDVELVPSSVRISHLT